MTENSPEGTIIAQAEFLRQGKSEVDAYYLKESSGEDSNLFNITAQGEIVVAPGAIIDFEKTASYVRWLSVHNSFGNSPTVKVTINVIDLLVEPPVTNPTGLNILENSESGTPVGQLQFTKGGVQDVSIELSGPGSENFAVENNGLVKVAPSANLDFERVAYYDLDYKVTNTAGSSSNKLYISVNNVPDVAAILHNGTFTQYYHEFIVGNAVGNVLSKIGDTPIKTITLFPDSPFGIRLNGDLYLKSALNTEKTNYVLTAIAEDHYGKSNASTIEINVLAQPHLAATALSIGENAPGGTFVGKIEVISEGPVSIDSFTLSDTTDFMVDGNGTVRVAVGADLNFEKQQKYHLLAHAYNAFGQSNIVTLDIALNNIPETAPVLRNVSTFYYTGQPSNISLGNIIVSHGDTPINVLTLLPDSPFTVEFDGSIRLSEELPVSSPSEFNLTAEAGNAFGKSNQANVDILVCTQASECMEYVRQLYMELQQASLGPIAGASFLLQELNTGSNSVIFEGVTSTSELLVDNGIIVFPQTLQESVALNDLFILSVNGGNDMDADDDFEFDETPQQNLGTIRAILSGAHVQGESFKVNVLTEIAYQALHRRFDESTTNQSVSAMLNEVSKRLIKNDLNKDGVITYKDTTSWLPGFDKDKLQFDYDAKIEPIVQKIYNNEDIYLDVYKLLYAGKIDSLEFDNNATGNSIRVDLNSYADLSQLRKEDFVLKDSSGNSVDFTFGIVDDKVVIDPLNDFVEGQSYTLSFNLEIYDDQNNVYIDSQSHEFIVPDMTPPVIPESTIHINENYGGELPFSATDPSTPIMYTLIEGADKDKFEVKNSGSSLYFKEAPNYERPSDSNGDNIYELDISVADSFANTTTQSIRIIIDDLKEAPLLADTYMTVNENMPIGTYVGSVTVLNEGDGNLTSFSIYSDEFRIDTAGKIYTKQFLDYEHINEYNLSVRATNSVNAHAASKMSNIKVSDIEEPIPHVHNFTGSMDDHAPEGKVVGQLYVYPGLDEEVTIRLLGEGADDFDVNSTGHVTVSATADLDHTVQKQYGLKAIAKNSYGESEKANVTIYINIWTKQANDLGSSIFVDTQDNIYTAIEISGGVSVNKFNAQGVKLWKQEYLGHERVTIQSIVVDDHGTVYLACKQGTKPYTSNNWTYYRTSALVLVLSSSGELWNKSVDTGSAYYDEFTKITLDIDGNLILAGRTNGTLTGEINHGGSDPFLIKLSNQGEPIWIQQYGSSGYDFVSDVEFNSKNELYFLAENPTWQLMRIDQSDGHILWSKQLDPLYEGSWMYCYDFVFDNADNAYILAAQDKYWEVDGSDYYDGEVLVTKLDNDGSIIWRKTYGSERYEEPAAIAISSNNELYFVGRTDGSTYSNVSKTPYLWKWEEADFFLISTDTNGNIIETKQFGSIGWDFAKAMTIDTNNNVYMTGFVDGSLDGNVYKVESNYNTGFLMKVP